MINKEMKRLTSMTLCMLKGIPRIMVRGFHLGFCPICEKSTLFFKHGKWLRDHYRCVRCLSVPRNRALMSAVQEIFPSWRHLDIHESSPSGPTFKKLSSQCARYTPSYFLPEIDLGSNYRGYRCEDLTCQTFGDSCFDLIITQDVLEHVFTPIKAFKEIHRTLKPGGAHIFTVPWYSWRETKERARKVNGYIVYLEKPDYHKNPISKDGSLVVTEWGRDLCNIIFRSTGMETTVVRKRNITLGIDAEFNEVFVSRRRKHGNEVDKNRYTP